MQHYRNVCFVLCMPRPELNFTIYVGRGGGGSDEKGKCSSFQGKDDMHLRQNIDFKTDSLC